MSRIEVRTQGPRREALRQVPSSASTGMFMTEPVLENQYLADSSFRRVVDLFLPPSVIQSTTRQFSRLADEVISKKVLDWVGDAERNVPFVRGAGRNAFGQRTDELITSEGWKQLQKMGLKEGIVAIAYENRYEEYSRSVQFVKYHIWTGSAAYVTCPSAMQDGAASLLKSHIAAPSTLDPIKQEVFTKAFESLTSRAENAWTSGQWMTERSGGSDVSGTETIAIYSPEITSANESTQVNGLPLGPWVIDGFKWFSSATDSQMSIALAQTPGGLSTFYIPMNRTTAEGANELNGISISRLKNKLGTKALPTAELELKGARGFLVGEEGNGIREISAVLNITRIHTAATAIGLWGRGLAIGKAFTKVRHLTGKGKPRLLKDVPLHVKTMADVTLSYRANLLFLHFTVYLLGISDQPLGSPTSQQSPASDYLRPKTSEDLRLLLRILTPPLKALTSKAAISGLQECMESLGGIGYLENEESQHINIARLFRDVNVLSIWEGTTNVLGTDFVKILKGRNGAKTLSALYGWVSSALFGANSPTVGFMGQRNGIVKHLEHLTDRVEQTETDELLLDARELMEDFAIVVSGTLMIVDAERDGDAVSVELCRRFAWEYGLVPENESDWTHRTAWDRKIVFGKDENPQPPKPRL